MKTGILILSGVIFLIEEIIMLEKNKTKVKAAPIKMPFSNLFETASAEHNPIINRKSGFSATIPFLISCHS
jgi:hypothetical protein